MLNVFYRFKLKNFIHHFAGQDNWHEIDLNTSSLGYGEIHYALIRSLKPKRVLCIGSRYGFIPAVCALACKNNKFGVVDFVDASFDMDEPEDQENGKHWGGVGFWKKINPKKHFGKFGLNQYICTHVMTTQQFKKNFPKRRYEYIYIDGDHSYQGVKNDFDSFWSQLNQGGYCSLHDIFTQDYCRSDYGVEKFWSEIKKKYGGIEFGKEIGLGIIQKLNEKNT